MELVYKYEYDETPDYTSLKTLFTKELRDNGWKDSSDGLDWLCSFGKVCVKFLLMLLWLSLKSLLFCYVRKREEADWFTLAKEGNAQKTVSWC